MIKILIGFLIGVAFCQICSYLMNVVKEEQDYFDKHDHE